MLTYDLKKDSHTSLYEDLYQRIKKDILSGTLSPGEPLPSKRAFAKHLSVSTITIENAYAQLYAEGLIYSIPRSGFYVTDLSMHRGAYLSPDTERSKPNQTKEPSTPQKKETYFADFAGNEITPDLFPFATWARISRNVLSMQQEELLTNPPAKGVYSLREAIAGHLLAFRDIHVDPAQIVIGAGTEYLYTVLLRLIGTHGIYGVEDPGYARFTDVCNSFQVPTVGIPLDPKGVRSDLTERSHVRALHLTPSHHFPTGITMPISRRMELLSLAKTSSTFQYLIEDDYDSEFRMSGRPIASLYSIDSGDSVIYLNTFTKSLASTIRISYMILPRPLLEKFDADPSLTTCPVSNFEQYTLAHFIAEGYFEKHLNRMRNHYRKKRNLLLKTIEESPLGKITDILEENSGLHFLLEIPDPKTDETTLIKNIRKAGIRVKTLNNYRQKKDLPPRKKHSPGKQITLLINYSSIRPEQIPEAIERLYLGITQSP